MKKLLFFIMLLSGLSFGQQAMLTQNFTSAVAGTSINLTNSPVTVHRISWTPAGTVTTCTVALDSSADGISWNAGGVIAGQTCTSGGVATFTVADVNFVRINVTTLTGGGNLNVAYTGYVVAPTGGTGAAATQVQGTQAAGSAPVGNLVDVGFFDSTNNAVRMPNCVLNATACIINLGIAQSYASQDGDVNVAVPLAPTGGGLSLLTAPLIQDNNGGTLTQTVVTGQIHDRTTSALATQFQRIYDLHNVHDTLAITSTCSAGTATTTIEGCSDSTCASGPLTIDSLAAAATNTKQYFGQSTVGVTLALSPLAFRWIRITEASCGAGNTSTTNVAIK